MISRLLAMALFGSLSLAPAPAQRDASGAGLRTPKPTLSAESESAPEAPETLGGLSLGSISWEGQRASAEDLRGRRHVLTLDRWLQVTAAQLLRSAKPSRGAIVVLSAVDSRVLALAEFPAASRAESLLWSANTPSASLFKLITTAALVERAQLQPDHRVCSEGGEHRLRAEHLQAPKHGHITCSAFSEILAFSRNAAYARLVNRYLSPEDLANFADRFGFNAPLPADVTAELGRFRPTSDPLRFAKTATGFVGSSLSTIGAAYLGLVIAQGGVPRPLRLLAGAEPASGTQPALLSQRVGETRPLADATDRGVRVLEPGTATRLREMMERVVNYGTAADAFRDGAGRRLLPSLRIAGKTGTLGRDERTASWFVGFAPSRDPKVVVAVLLDNGPTWQTTAKRVASALLTGYFDRSDGVTAPNATSTQHAVGLLRQP